jgi:fatty acid desaturase
MLSHKYLKITQNNRLFLSPEDLTILNKPSNQKAIQHLIGHLLVTGCSGYVWGTHLDSLILAIPFLIIYGFSLAAMFAVVHETSHGTAFTTSHVNAIVGWWAGILSFYNSNFFRRSHKWHHRYTQIPEKDPELEDAKPTNLKEYLWEITELNWWIGKVKGHIKIALGNLENYPYISASAREEVIRSTRLQLLVYLGAITVSAVFRQPWFIIYWLLPLMVGQPMLRVILLAEHIGCSYNNNPLTNTRTTLTIRPVRFLMWNMPFHAEHHLYPSLPFHKLPVAHEKLNSYFTKIDPGFIHVHQEIIAKFFT